MNEPISEQTAKELVLAIQYLTDAIKEHTRVKERGVKLAERIQIEKEHQVWH